MIVTTNRSIASWGEIFTDAMMAAAILDRFLFRATLLASTATPTGCGPTGSASSNCGRVAATAKR